MKLFNHSSFKTCNNDCIAVSLTPLSFKLVDKSNLDSRNTVITGRSAEVAHMSGGHVVAGSIPVGPKSYHHGIPIL